MRIVHFAQFGPRACGLYETVKDIILAERKLGADARLVDCDGAENIRIGLKDGDITTDDPEICFDADVLIRHTAVPVKYHNIGKPVVMCLHGRPESSFRLSIDKTESLIQAISNKAADARYKAFVSFWPEFEPHWQAIVGDKLNIIPAPVNLDYYSSGDKKELAGSHKILIADIWRDDVTPLSSIFGAVRYIDKYEPAAKIHIVGIPTDSKRMKALQPFLKGLKRYIGSAAGHMIDIRSWYKSCDCVVTPHTIATRIIRESLTAGLPVVAGADCKYTDFRADHASPDDVAAAIKAALADPQAPARARKIAEMDFDSLQTAGKLIVLCEKICGQKREKRKIFLDIGSHLGESVRRFYRQRPDADEFEIYSFEPDPEIFGKMFNNIGAIPNVTCINAALGSVQGKRKMHKGRANDGEGSTLFDGKLTGGLQGQIDIRAMDIKRFFESLADFDYCIVKMNIEGGEYELLPYLVGSGLMGSIDELYVQMHSLKFDLTHRIEMDKVELQWLEDMLNFSTKVYSTTKGMADFGNTSIGKRKAG